MLPYRHIMKEDADPVSLFFGKYPSKRYSAKEIILSSGDDMEFLDDNGHFKSVLIRSFARGLEGYVVRSFFLIKGSAMQKVASSLLLLLKRFGKESDAGRFIDLPLTHQDIANLSGITRET